MSETKNRRIYLAGPLFTQAEWQWNERLARLLSDQSFNVILPQRRAEPMLTNSESFKPDVLFHENLKGIDESDVVVAILDGSDADSGTCWECGYAYKLGRPVIGVRTDIRASGDDPKVATNLMLSISCSAFIAVPFANRDNVAKVADQIARAVDQLCE